MQQAETMVAACNPEAVATVINSVLRLDTIVSSLAHYLELENERGGCPKTMAKILKQAGQDAAGDAMNALERMEIEVGRPSSELPS